jgi:catechol 2,3-dioxygenase-like lactoylglutathione lyase family enzyme
MAVRRLNHAVLYVRDLARTVSFYRETLGFEVRTEVPGRAAFLSAPGSANDHDLGLFQIDGAGPPAPGPHVGLYHLAWEVGSLPDLIEAREKLSAAGALVGQSDHRVSKSRTPRTRTASSSRSCGASPPKTGTRSCARAA